MSLAKLILAGVLATSPFDPGVLETQREDDLEKCEEMCDHLFGSYGGCLREFPLFWRTSSNEGESFLDFSDTCTYTLQERIYTCKKTCEDEYGGRKGI